MPRSSLLPVAKSFSGARWPALAALLAFACGNGAPYAADRAPAAMAPPRAAAAGHAPATTPETEAAGASEAKGPVDAHTDPQMAQPEPAPIRPALEHPEALKHFYESLAHLEDGTAKGVLVAQWGDSHTAADLGTSTVRHVLQARFGDGGRGFVAIGKPWPTYVQDGVRGGMTREFVGERGKLTAGKFVGDGRYGLAGFAIQSSRKKARAWTEVHVPASHIELAYLEQPGGGSFDVFIDDVKKGKISTHGATARSAFHAYDVPEGPHKIEVRPRGDGMVRLFGLSLGRSKEGVVLDALGINGARITTALQWQEPHMAEQIHHRTPDLFILAYGTNEAGDDTPIQVYQHELLDVLGRMSRAAPSASCLLLGPPDRGMNTPDGWMTMPRLIEIVEAQRAVAKSAGCAFYSQFDAMGGAGSIANWVAELEPRARRDYVHLTREGYTQFGQAIAADLLRGYDAFRGTTDFISTR